MPIEPVSASTMVARSRTFAREAVEQRGIIAAMIVAFLGVAIVGPKLTRLRTPRTRAQKLRHEAAFRAELLRRRARTTSAKAQKNARKTARRLGGGRVERYL